MEEYAKHEQDLIRKYEAKGYSKNFRYAKGKLIETESKKEFGPKQITVIEEHRYEGMSNPSDMSILYVIETSDNDKGIFLMAYGPNADTETAEFFKEIPQENFVENE
ncbi:hypothetical protein [Cytophaga sp. FL35]|uniref:hypothetical protein n=1 Tax=Cytophaga sp. FL35 TaxID=1904456 RepID=UPI001653EB69|nr:hypothetical protein [Cytophaga sp. FL35]MBC6998128.1 hypothetical protein [Cytophaga sp. FL35]